MSYELCDMMSRLLDLKRRHVLLILSVLFFCTQLLAQKSNLNESAIFLASITFHPTDLPLSTPFISLQDGEITLRFDDLNASYASYNIRIRHCTKDWWQSDLHPSEYLEGFHDIPIDDMEDSFGTKVDYTHYTINLPRDDFAWTKSGNYVIEVFNPNSPKETLISRRFVVYEDLSTVSARVIEPVDIALKRTHQEVSFNVTEDRYRFLDPYNNLFAVVLQNGRWDNKIQGLKPRFIKGREIDYSETGYIFSGSNSYRYADLKSLLYSARGVDRIIEGEATFHHILNPSERRTYTYHTSWPDIDGRFIISNDRYNPETGSDYTMTHFSLPMPYEIIGRDIFIFGDISEGKCLHTHQLHWNNSTSTYEAKLLLKQGYYDYLYLVKDSDSTDSSPGESSDIEGNHFATDNLYTVIIYYSDFEGYDRVVGFLQLSSNPQ